MAKKAKKVEGSVMEQLASVSLPWDDDENKVDKPEDMTKTLMERVSKAETELELMRRQNAYSSFQSGPAKAPAPQGTTQKAIKTSVDLSKLPDPVADVEKFKGALAEEMNEVLNGREMQLRAEAEMRAEQERLGTQLWNGFKAAHPGWEDHQEVVSAVASQVNQGLLAKKVDVVALMQQQPDLFYKEVAGVLDKKYSALKKDAEDDEDDGDEAPAQVFGGQPGKGNGVLAAAGQSVEADNKAWLRELGEIRHKAGVR